jgi:hypothetical protein
VIKQEGFWTYILILAIPRRAVSVVKRLQHFRTQNVGCTRDVEPSLVVKLLLISRYSALVPAEPIGADSRERLVVIVLAASDELEAEVDVSLFFQDQAAEDEVAAVEAG